jgi:hypothetical protein
LHRQLAVGRLAAAELSFQVAAPAPERGVRSNGAAMVGARCHAREAQSLGQPASRRGPGIASRSALGAVRGNRTVEHRAAGAGLAGRSEADAYVDPLANLQGHRARSAGHGRHLLIETVDGKSHRSIPTPGHVEAERGRQGDGRVGDVEGELVVVLLAPVVDIDPQVVHGSNAVGSVDTDHNQRLIVGRAGSPEHRKCTQ